jgi:hypothetical protein
MELLGYCKECCESVFEKDRIEARELFECSSCGHPHTKEELLPERSHVD